MRTEKPKLRMEEFKMKAWRKIKMEIENYEVGDQIIVKFKDLGKFTATAQRVYEDGKTLFLFDNCVAEHEMNENNSNAGGFYKSDLCKWMNTELVKSFPVKLLDRMIYTDKEHECLLRIPTRKEMFGEDGNSQNYEPDLGEQFELMKDRKNRVCSLPNGEYAWYWLMNKYIRSSSRFASVFGDGSAYGTSASSSTGVRPAFLIR